MTLTQEEWKELKDLKRAINEYPASVHWDKMERFGYLMVKSLNGDCEKLETAKTNN
jgi:hypothetical protein